MNTTEPGPTVNPTTICGPHVAVPASPRRAEIDQMRHDNIVTGYGCTMSTSVTTAPLRVTRRQRGSLDDNKQVALWLERSARERLEHLANAAGVTKSAYAQWLIETAEVGPDGVPVGWPAPHQSEEALPIEAA